MPLTLTLTEGVLPKGQEPVALARLSEAMLRWHGLAGNQTMADNVVGEIKLLPRGSTFAGMREAPVVLVEWKVPSFAFSNREVQIGYFAEATEILFELSGGKQRRDHIFVNVTHTVDGAWNWGGRSLTNAEIAAEISKG